MLRIFKIRFYCAEISEQDIFQSVLLFLPYLFDRLMFQAARKIQQCFKTPTNTKMQEKIS